MAKPAATIHHVCGSGTVVTIETLTPWSVLTPPGDKSEMNNTHSPFGSIPLKLASMAVCDADENAEGADCGSMFCPDG